MTGVYGGGGWAGRSGAAWVALPLVLERGHGSLLGSGLHCLSVHAGGYGSSQYVLSAAASLCPCSFSTSGQWDGGQKGATDVRSGVGCSETLHTEEISPGETMCLPLTCAVA